MSTSKSTDSFTIVGAAIFDGSKVLEASSLSVEDGVLTEIGTRGRAAAAKTPSGAPAKVINADGGLVTPGFVDAHAHPVFAGIEALSLDLTDREGADDCLQAIAAALQTGSGWLRGGGWTMSDFADGNPPAELLDALGAKLDSARPIALVSRDHHSMWCNTRALELAGITASTPDPAGGTIVRTEDGSPQGTLHEAAMDMVSAAAPPLTQDQVRAGLFEGHRQMHAHGITGCVDAIVGPYTGNPDTYDAYREVAASGQLTMETAASLWWPRNVEDPAAFAKQLAERLVDGPLFRARQVKFMLDGVIESQTAAMLSPYSCPCGGHGVSYFSRSHLRESFSAVDHAGFDIHCHAIGDAAVREALDALEATGRQSPRARSARHHIAHVQVVAPEDVPRFGSLGVTANLQALWAHRDDQMVQLNLPVLGDDRAGWQYPFKALRDSGAPLAMGSDWPVSTSDPWQAMHVACNRTHPSAPGREPLAAEQKLKLVDCLRAYTSGSRRIGRMHNAGRLQVGAPVDLALASQNPLSLPVGELSTVENLLTVAGGRTVFVHPQAEGM